MKNEAIPRLRFKGFNDNWTLKCLNDIAYIVGGGTPSTKNPNFWNGDINWYSPNEISTINSPYVYFSKRKITKEGLKHSSAHLHPANTTILLTTRATIGDMAILKIPASTNQGFQSLELHKDICPYFVYSDKNKIKHKALRLSHGSTFKEISKSDLKELKLNIPSLPEQQLIGKFFAKLDKLIQLQQKKVSLLKKLKRGYLQKLFPQPGTCFPLLRFKGFFKPWLCSKASTLFKSISEKNHPKLPVLSSTQTKGLVYRKDLNSDIKYNPKSLPNYKVIHKGDFVISLRSFQGGFECSNKLGIISAAYTVFNFINRFNQNTYFWKTFFKSYIFLQLLKKITFGIRDGKSIKFTGFKSLKLKYPSYKEECKLGKLFKNMNNNIDIQKNKLTHLRKLKKAYLQKMFC